MTNEQIRDDAPAVKPVLVTGASGFIGERLVRQLVADHCPVFCLVRGSSRTEALQSLGAHLAVGDVTDADSVTRALDQSRAATVYHLAGLVKAVRRSDFTRVNVGGVATVAAACAARTDPPTLLLVSSLAAAGPTAAGGTGVESDIPRPISHYGRSKLAGELAAATYAAATPITIVRPPIVFGPGDRAVLEIFRPIARRGVHVVPGPRGVSRRFSLIHVDDLVRGLLLATDKGERLLSNNAPAGQGCYYLTDEAHPTYVELGDAIALALGRKPPARVHVPAMAMRIAGIVADAAATIRRRPGWISRDKITEALAPSWTCSAEKARRQLGWDVACGLADRLRETAQWYREAEWL